ncbi:hemerythrin domain-containing protein [Chitinophaga nivalis]|uniref:Hemerythrin domain-containing protein n=1 Tax=Chitinophaga nivalis TaxID=2991709 RepID=A0ABT3IPU2_9BACT|nr:hemerythrin domain-containing protein [Chitinophaga nivalis]MCW3464327.1 hemerythrin domain-containing protein [Chitinophaga nivalis]MCW3485982.1 hemerythrin domain-containing protein [Chitinophaga nivalis]
MERHLSLIPLSHEHKRLLFVCRYLKRDAAPYEGFPLETQAKLAYVVKIFQEVMVPHIQKETYLFEKCAGKHPQIDALIQELEEEHRIISGMYGVLAGSKELDADMDKLARHLETHIRKEERVFFMLLQEHLPDILASLQWQP